MKRVRLLLGTAVLGVILLGGCAPLLPVTALPEGQGTKENVTILRNYNFYGAGIYFWPTVDNADVAGLFVKEHTSFQLSEGRHVLGVRCFGGLVPMWHHHQIETQITDGSPRYFLLSPYILGCAEIQEIDAAEAVVRFGGSTRIKTGHISNCEGESVQPERRYDYCSRNLLP